MWFIKKIFLLLFSVIAFSQTELKFNLATAPLLIPNIGIEVKLSDKLGFQLDTSASFYNDIEGSPFHMTQIFNEFRYYPNKNQKRNFFIGAHIGYGMYNIRLPKWIATISGSEFKELPVRKKCILWNNIKKIPLKNEKFNLEIFIVRIIPIKL